MCEDRRQEHEVEAVVGKRKSVFPGLEVSRRIVEFAKNVRQLEVKVGIFRSDMRRAPLNPLGNDINAFVAATRREVFRQRHRHSPDAASYVQNAVISLKAAEPPEI